LAADIAAHDVCFAEDSSPSELTVVEMDAPLYDPGAVNNLVDSTLTKDVVVVPELSYNMRPRIYSGLKLNKFHDFIPQSQN